MAGRCREYGEGITLWPLREAIAQVLGETAPPASSAIPAVAVRRVAAAVGLEDGEPGEDTDWAFTAARRRDSPAARRSRSWSTTPTGPSRRCSTCCSTSSRGCATRPCSWCGSRGPTCRSAPATASGAATVLTLRRLSGAASASLLATLGGDRLPPAAQRQVADAAGGNPLFLEQLVAYVDEQHAADALPPALHALLAARLDRLDATERATLALGAVAGDAFTSGSVHALATGLTRAGVEQACERLLAARPARARARARARCASGTR